MANTYEWSIKKLNKNLDVDSNLFDNPIGSIKWGYKITNENGIFIELLGETKLETPNLNFYIPYDDLTKNQLIEWLESKTNIEALKLDGDFKILKLTQNSKIPLRKDLL